LIFILTQIVIDKMQSILIKYIDFFADSIPEFFSRLNKQCLRGNRIGMEIGKLRERQIVALLQILSEKETTNPFVINYELDDNLEEVDVRFNNTDISIKTFTGTSCSNNIKLVWTSDKQNCRNFVKHFKPHADLLIVNIPKSTNGVINGTGMIYYIPRSVQQNVYNKIGSKYYKIPKDGRNSRGVELTNYGYQKLIENKNTLCLYFPWNKEKINHSYDPVEQMRNELKDYFKNKTCRKRRRYNDDYVYHTVKRRRI
jgi:hypothetical protein